MVARALAAVPAVLVLVATLHPTRSMGTSRLLECLVCGDRGWADVLLNICLFVPLGASVALGGRSTRWTLLAATALSSGVETAQFFIPGRDASLGDLLFNTIGAAFGVLLVRSAPRWLAPPRRVAVRLSLACGTAAVAAVAATGWLLAPALPASTYFVQWTPVLRHLEPYRGRVHASRLAGRPLRPGRAEDSGQIRRGLEEGAALTVDLTAGPPVSELAAVFAVFDYRRREIVLLGQYRDDLLFRYRTRAAALRLDQPDLRIRDGMGRVDEGERLRLRVSRQGRRFCAAIGPEATCELGFSAGIGWSFFLYAEGWPLWVRKALSVLWLAALFGPAGYYARGRRVAVAAGLMAMLALGAVPLAVGLLATPIHEALGAAAGLVLGAVVAARTEARGSFSSSPAGDTAARSAASSPPRCTARRTSDAPPPRSAV